ncbi:MAG: protein kinase [Polyangiaceae bacterium]|nr:protein kinase [Polyangiaceae bacterium]
MGVVVSALHTQLGERVAIKFLLGDALDPQLVARFLREAQAAVKVKSEHVARVIDVGTLESGAPYMVMEHLVGQDLAQVVELGGPLSESTAIEYVLQACEAIAEAHAHGIVHRDLKPANLFLTRRADGSTLVKVLDFGISKQLDAAGQIDLTATQTALGSPAYMSPEQVRSARHVDQRTDLWSLGVILTELVTGRHPFSAPTMSAMMAAIVADPPRRLRELDPRANEALDLAVARCLEKDPSRRFDSVAALATALGPLAPPAARLSIERIVRLTRASSPAELSETLAAPTPHVTAGHEQRTVAEWHTPAPPRKGGRAALLVGAGLTCAVALAVVALRSRSQASPEGIIDTEPVASAVAPAPPASSAAAPPASIGAPPASAATPSASIAPPVASSKATPKRPATPAKPSPHVDDRNW